MKVIPAIVTYEDAVSLGAVRKWADDQLRETLEQNGVDTMRVGPLLIFNTHDIELLEALTHKTEWVRLISGFADYVSAHRKDPIATFNVFVSKSNFPLEDPNTSHLAKIWKAAMAFAQENVPEPEANNRVS